VTIIPADLAQPRSARALAEQLAARGIQTDVLVNNAGFGLHGEFAELPIERQLDMIQLNVTTVSELTRLLLPGMLARGTGGVLNVASTAAFQPGPLMSVYYATKAFVLSFTEGVAEEVAGRGVKVSCLCPGPTETEFAARADVVHTNLFKEAAMGVEEVAREGFEGWTAGRVVIVPGFKNKQRMIAVRLAPRSFVRRAVKRANGPARS
jgi:short-subunit dehydrogenase